MKNRMILLLFVTFLGLTWATARSATAALQDVERVSVGTGGAESNADSYFISLSADANIVAFQSFDTSWFSDQPEVNYVDVYVRNRLTNTTTKISVSPGGEPSDQRSFDATVSTDGRYVVFNSYATNLVPDDNNQDEWVDNGLDVFLYDTQTGGNLQRVTLDWQGKEIYGNSVGMISGNGQYIVFTSSGNGIAKDDITNSLQDPAVYVRDWQTGAIERITKGPDDAFPNGEVAHAMPSYDGRYIVYSSEASNLAYNDYNGHRDILLYDRVTQQTKIISQGYDGLAADGPSNRAHISPDGRYITFHSEATNLVPGDTNGLMDIFLYDRLTDEMQRVSVSANGTQANGLSREPASCGNGRYVVFTSDATNLVPTPHNGERQTYMRDMLTNEVTLVTASYAGGMGDGRAHRATFSDDCRYVGFSTEANNIIPNDSNGVRDLFIARITRPADFTPSTIVSSGHFAPGGTVKYTLQLANSGTEAAEATFTGTLPAHTSYVANSLVGAGAVYNSSLNRIEWSGMIAGEDTVMLSYEVTIDPDLVDFTLITHQALLSGDGGVRPLTAVFAVNGLETYLPLVATP